MEVPVPTEEVLEVLVVLNADANVDNKENADGEEIVAAAAMDPPSPPRLKREEREMERPMMANTLFTVISPPSSLVENSSKRKWGKKGKGGEEKEEESAQILRRLKEQRIAFEETCTTSVFPTFSVIEPESSYFALRKWVNERVAPGMICNVVRLFNGSSTDITKRTAGLSTASKRMLETPNAGGNSIWSEVISLEMLSGMYGAALLRTELEILYGCHSKITDFSVQIMGHHIGVSVTRAMKFRGIFNADDAIRLMKKKLNGVVRSTRGVIREHRWEKQILHVFAECDYVADTIRRIYDSEIEEEDKANTMIIITVARDCPWLF